MEQEINQDGCEISKLESEENLGRGKIKNKKTRKSCRDFLSSLITMSPLPLLLLLLHHHLHPDTLPHSWQQQTKRADFSGLRRGRSAFDLSPLRRRESGGSQAKRRAVHEGKVNS